MARIRTIKPEFWEDEQVGALCRDARLLFIAIWTNSDDEGLLRWSAPFLKSAAFAYDDDIDVAAVERLMEELTEKYLVICYQPSPQQKIGWVLNFHKHQKINRPTPSRLAPPSLASPQIRSAYGRRDRMRCHLCGEEINSDETADKLRLSVDHIIPRSKGGSDYPSNILAVHQSCNKRRVNKNLRVTKNSQSDSVRDSLSLSLSSSPLEGKGREGSRNGVENGRRATPIPTDFTITEELRQQATTRIPDVDPDELFVQFRAHHESHGKIMKSWPAAWTTWIGNAVKFGYPKKQSTVRKWD